MSALENSKTNSRNGLTKNTHHRNDAVAGSFLDKLNFIASRARNDRRPFGGVREYIQHRILFGPLVLMNPPQN